MNVRKILAAFVAIIIPTHTLLAQEPDIRSFVSGSFKEIRSSHAGLPTIVHFWGLSCGPCLLELPEWGKLLDQRPGLNLVVVHADRLPRDVRLLAGAIERTGLAKAQNWAFGDDSSERLQFEVDPKWQGEIPMTLLIAADGTTKRIIGSCDMADIAAWLDAQSSHRGSGASLPNINSLKDTPALNGVRPNAIGTL